MLSYLKSCKQKENLFDCKDVFKNVALNQEQNGIKATSPILSTPLFFFLEKRKYEIVQD